MPVSTSVTGMVLSAMPIGDYDKRLVILTRETGKISAFAKGARRPNSALLACSQPFSFGQFNLYSGRSSYTIMSCDITNYFPELRKDIESVYYGSYFCEFAEFVTKENNDEKEILKLLYQTLRAVIKKPVPYELIRAVFELKLMALMGEAPQVFQCVKCKKDAGEEAGAESFAHRERFHFSAECGGILCGACIVHDRGARLLYTSTLYAMQYIVSRDIENLYTFAVSDKVLKELMICMKEYLARYIGHEFNSCKAIKSLPKEKFSDGVNHIGEI